MIQLKTLANNTIQQLFSTHQSAFIGYPRSWTKSEFESMLRRRGYTPQLSVGAFTEENQLVSFTLMGIGLFNNLKTAYDISTGTVDSYRGQGLASQIFEYSVPTLRAAGIDQCLLEVLQTNTAAVKLYQRQGFTISRELFYFINNKRELILHKHHNHQIEVIHLEQIAGMADMWDFVPSWQNTLNSLRQAPEDFKALGMFKGGRLIAYGVIECITGDIPQIAVSTAFRRQGIGTAILQELGKLLPLMN